MEPSCLFRNGEKYAAEIHFVHVNPKTGKAAVLGVFVQSSQARNSSVQGANELDSAASLEWKRYFTAVQTLRGANDTTTLSLNLSALLPRNVNYFWRYEGSLTTPSCSEIVTWTVLKTMIVVDEVDLQDLRRSVIPMNYREPQPLYNRVVYRSFPDAVVSSVPDDNVCGNGAPHNRFQVVELVLLFFFSLK